MAHENGRVGEKIHSGDVSNLAGHGKIIIP